MTQGNHGAVTLSNGNTVTYTPDADYLGDDSFNYTTSDDQGDTVAATMDVSNYAPGQWASSVIDYSSQYSATASSAAQALGPPDTFGTGDQPTAWSASSQDGTQETLTLGFSNPVYATGFTIHETNGNGFVTQVDLIGTDGTVYTVWAGIDSTPLGGGFFVIDFPATNFLTQAIRIYVSTDQNPGISSRRLTRRSCAATPS